MGRPRYRKNLFEEDINFEDPAYQMAIDNPYENVSDYGVTVSGSDMPGSYASTVTKAIGDNPMLNAGQVIQWGKDTGYDFGQGGESLYRAYQSREKTEQDKKDAVARKEEEAAATKKSEEDLNKYMEALNKSLESGMGTVNEFGGNALRSVDEGYSAALDEATRGQAMAARRGVERSARMGGSAEGGMSQAGAAQAQLSGQSLKNQAIGERTANRLGVYGNVARMKLGEVDRQYQAARDMYSAARNDAEKKLAWDRMLELENLRGRFGLAQSLAASGDIENEEAIADYLSI